MRPKKFLASAMLVAASVATPLTVIAEQIPASPGIQVPTAPPATLWRFLGFQRLRVLRDATVNSRGLFPSLERQPPLLRIADPANLASDNPAIKAAAEIKKEEYLAPQKIKGIKYLARIGCSCYDKDGKVSDALIGALDDCSEEVRYEAAKALRDAAGDKCKKCNGSCCKKDVVEKLAKVAYEKKDGEGEDGCCWFEPSARVRDMAKQAIKGCAMPGLPPIEYLPMETIEGPIQVPEGPEQKKPEGPDAPPVNPTDPAQPKIQSEESTADLLTPEAEELTVELVQPEATSEAVDAPIMLEEATPELIVEVPELLKAVEATPSKVETETEISVSMALSEAEQKDFDRDAPPSLPEILQKPVALAVRVPEPADSDLPPEPNFETVDTAELDAALKLFQPQEAVPVEETTKQVAKATVASGLPAPSKPVMHQAPSPGPVLFHKAEVQKPALPVAQPKPSPSQPAQPPVVQAPAVVTPAVAAAKQPVAKMGGVAQVHSTQGVVQLSFVQGSPPPVGSQVRVVHKGWLRTTTVGDLQVVGYQGQAVLARPMNGLELNKVSKGDQVFVQEVAVAKAVPVKMAPAKPAAVKVELAKVAPVKSEPAKVEVAKVEPAKTSVAQAKPQTTVAVAATPVKKVEQAEITISDLPEDEQAELIPVKNTEEASAPRRVGPAIWGVDD